MHLQNYRSIFPVAIVTILVFRKGQVSARTGHRGPDTLFVQYNAAIQTESLVF